jgi:hypothetical protein
VGVLVAVDEEASLNAGLSDLIAPLQGAPVDLLEVNKYGGEGERVHTLALLVDDLQLAVVLIHDAKLGQCLG